MYHSLTHFDVAWEEAFIRQSNGTGYRTTVLSRYQPKYIGTEVRNPTESTVLDKHKQQFTTKTSLVARYPPPRTLEGRCSSCTTQSGFIERNWAGLQREGEIGPLKLSMVCQLEGDLELPVKLGIIGLNLRNYRKSRPLNPLTHEPAWFSLANPDPNPLPSSACKMGVKLK